MQSYLISHKDNIDYCNSPESWSSRTISSPHLKQHIFFSISLEAFIIPSSSQTEASYQFLQ